jgi:opacity protein-like surface antigen
MKRFFVFALTLALVAIFALSASAAERKGMIGVGVGGGLLLPMGDFGDAFKMGWRAGAGVGYFLTNEIMLGAAGAYSQNKVDDTTGVGDATFKMMQYGVFGKYMFKMQNDKIAPYVKAGLGFYNGKVSVSGGGSSASNTDMGINGGVGAMFSVSPTASIFVEGAYHNVFSDPSSTNFITGTAGVAFMFGGSGGGATQ